MPTFFDMLKNTVLVVWSWIVALFTLLSRLHSIESRLSNLEEYLPSDSPIACVNCSHIHNPITDMGSVHKGEDDMFYYHATRTCKRCGHKHLYEIPKLIRCS